MSKTRRAVKPSEEAGQAPAVSNRRLAGGAPRPLRAPHRAAGHERSAGGPEAAGPSRPPPSDSRWTDLGGAKLRRWGTPCLPLPGASPERGKEGGDGVRRRRRRRRRRRVRRPPPTRSWQEPLPEPPGHPRDRSVWSPQGAAGPPGGTMQPLWTAPSRPPLSVPAKPGRLQVAPGVGGMGGGEAEPLQLWQAATSLPGPEQSPDASDSTLPCALLLLLGSRHAARRAAAPVRTRRRGLERAAGAGQGEPLAGGTRGRGGGGGSRAGPAAVRGGGGRRRGVDASRPPGARARPSPPAEARPAASRPACRPPPLTHAGALFPRSPPRRSLLNYPPRRGAPARLRGSCPRSGGPTDPCLFPGGGKGHRRPLPRALRGLCRPTASLVFKTGKEGRRPTKKRQTAPQSQTRLTARDQE